MPEGHTIHRLARDHATWFAGQRVRVSSASGRFADAAALLDGHVLEGTDAYGKHLFHRFEGDRYVHVHLGLFGKVLVSDVPPDPPRDTSRYRVVGDDRAIDLVGATACDLLIPEEVTGLVARLGPDPIRRDADPDRAWAALQRRSIGIGRALMDQAVLAGVGNVYRAEILFVHGLHPDVPAREVPRETWESMWATLVEWLRRGVRQQRIVTTDPAEIGKPRSRMRREESLYVYKQESCKRCEEPIRRWDLAGRWAYACETCQPPPRSGGG
ncbi:Fpg/Nei family DNA glycosylase [Nitriliruptor alkaliphilus]|uniref:Fpg/Nei family DNA glycosylase n=1 Tax=Nitriliruptor alkaliphilus TaxID=427918 RepID=UPI000697A387|nr:DNA-formamidopyrimidine glycosylase family protein [Nitriliruptor alkaliphilus]